MPQTRAKEATMSWEPRILTPLDPDITFWEYAYPRSSRPQIHKSKCVPNRSCQISMVQTTKKKKYPQVLLFGSMEISSRAIEFSLAGPSSCHGSGLFRETIGGGAPKASTFSLAQQTRPRGLKDKQAHLKRQRNTTNDKYP